MNKTFGVAAIIIATAGLITAVSTAVANFISFKWAVEAYKPIQRLVTKTEPLMNKMVTASEKYLDEYLDED